MLGVNKADIAPTNALTSMTYRRLYCIYSALITNA